MHRACWKVLPWLLATAPMVPALASAAPPTVTVASDALAPTKREVPVAAKANVHFRGQVMFPVDNPIGTLSVGQRAKAVEARLDAALAQPGLAAQLLRIEQTSDSSDIFLGEQFITSVTDADAKPRGRTRQQRAADIGIVLRHAVILQYLPDQYLPKNYGPATFGLSLFRQRTGDA